MTRLIDMAGKRCGNLLVIKSAGIGRGGYYLWECQCDCGSVVIVNGKELRNGDTVSCGCYHRKRSSLANKTHGESKSAEFMCWSGIIDRCLRPGSTVFKYYGGRGISICERWKHSFENFLLDMGRKPTPQHTIERNDYNGDYTPENCRWATRKEQANNSRRCHVLEAFGKSLNITQWSEETGISDSLIWARIFRLSWPVERALSVPTRKTKVSE